MTDFHTRYRVRVRTPDGSPPRHPSIQNLTMDHEGYYTLPFVHRRPRAGGKPAPTPKGFCRYVEDFVEKYGEQNVEVTMLGPLTDDWLASIQRAYIATEPN